MNREKIDILFNPINSRKELKQKAVRSASITMSAQMTGYLVQMIGTFIIARLVTPNDFGLVTMVYVFSLLLQNFGENGFTEYVLQKEKIDHQQLSNLFWLNCGINSVMAVLFILFAPVIVWFYKEPKLYHISIVMSFSIILGALPIQHLALLKRNMRFLKTSLNEVTSGLLSTVVAIALAMSGFGYWALVIRRIANPFFMAIGGWILCPFVPSKPKKRKENYSVLKYVFNTYGNFSLSYASRNLDKFLIGKFYGVDSLGFYDRAYHIAMLLPNQLSGSLASVAITTLSKLREEKERYIRNLRKILEIIALIATPLSVILAITGKDIILVLLGSQWDTAGVIFTAFAPSIGLMIMHATPGWVHLSLGRADRWFRWGIFRVTSASISIIIGLFWGPRGVAIAYSIYMSVTLIPALLYAGRPIGVSLSFTIEILWKYVIAGLFSLVSCKFIVMTLAASNIMIQSYNPIIRLILMAIITGISYCGLIVLLFRGIRPFKLVYEMLKEIFVKSKKIPEAI